MNDTTDIPPHSIWIIPDVPNPTKDSAGTPSGRWTWRWTGESPDPRLTGETTVQWHWRWIPPGTNIMGSRGWNADEEPRHEVIVAEGKGYWMMETPVTQLQYLSLIGKNPSHFKDRSDWKHRPVENIIWQEAVELCDRLQAAFSQHTKSPASSLCFRLPTEAEWEYACRAGSTRDYANGDGEEALDRIGWYGTNSGSETHPVNEKEANIWGLHDMHGNVFEWCQDAWDSATYSNRFHCEPVPVDLLTATTEERTSESDFRLVRGGDARGTAPFCRSAYRDGGRAGDRDRNQGLRAGGFPGPAIQPESEDGQTCPAERDKQGGQA